MSAKIRIAIVSVVVNAGLVGLKLLLARWSNSTAIFADAIHSLSDILVSLLVLSGLFLGQLAHKQRALLWQRLEDVVAIVVGFCILGAAVHIFTGAVTGYPRELVRLPLALLGILLCVLVSGIIARLKIKVGGEQNSSSLVADGYHSRMDMYSSIGVMIGLVGGMIGLNLDIQATAVIALLIAVTGLEVIYGAVRALLRGTLLEEYWLASFWGIRSARMTNNRLQNHRFFHYILWMRRRSRSLIIGILILAVILWLLSSVYLVRPGERALVFRYGRLLSDTGYGPGLHVHLPWPFESVQKISITRMNRLEIGFRTLLEGSEGAPQSYQWESRHVRGKYTKKPEESILFTGDENLIDMNTVVQYQVIDAKAFLLRVDDPEMLVRSAAEEAIRRVVGVETLDNLFTLDRAPVEERIQGFIQEAMIRSAAGISITAVKLQDVHPPVEVVDAFRDVASAREDKNRMINEAYAYHNEVLPKARGQGVDQIRRAEAEKTERTDHARGEADKFIALLGSYQRGSNVTEVRMFLETMEEILPGLEKFVVEPGASQEPVDLRFFNGQSINIISGEGK